MSLLFVLTCIAIATLGIAMIGESQRKDTHKIIHIIISSVITIVPIIGLFMFWSTVDFYTHKNNTDYEYGIVRSHTGKDVVVDSKKFSTKFLDEKEDDHPIGDMVNLKYVKGIGNNYAVSIKDYSEK